MDLTLCQRVTCSTILAVVIIVTLILPLPIEANVHNPECPQNCSCSTNDNTLYEVLCPMSNGELFTIDLDTHNGHVSLQCSSKMQMQDYDTLPTLSSLSSVENILSFYFEDCPLPKDSILNIITRLGISKQLDCVKFQTNTNMTTVLKRSHLANLENVPWLYFSGYPLSESKDIFEDMKNLQELNLKSSKINIHPDLFKPMTKLQALEIINCELTSFPKGSFKYLKSLENLSICKITFTNLTQGAFEGLDSLTELILNDNELNVLESDVFQYLPKLKTININLNHFQSLPENLFAKNSQLEKFQLMNNYEQINQLPNRLLSNLPNLMEVLMDDSEIESVPENLFFNSNQIINISLAGNNLINIPNFLFRDQINLRKLDLKNNKISSLPDTAFQTLIKLLDLTLDNNFITKISGNLFAGLLALQSLSIKHNNIKHISHNALQNTRKLEYIDMSYNNLTFLDNHELTFDDSSAHITLNSVVYSPFNSIEYLKYLYLSHNNISHICTDWRLSKPKLEILDLSFNQINYLQFTDIHFLSQKTEINLKNNKIFDIDFHIAEQMMKLNNNSTSSINILIENNPIQCTCSLHFFVTYQKRKIKSWYVNVDPGKTTCVSPPELKDVFLSKLTPYDLFCPLDALYTEEKECPQNCICKVRVVDRALNISCSGYSTNLNLPDAKSLQLEYIELSYKNIALNKISSLRLNSTVFNEIKNLYVSGNNISELTIEDIPDEIQIFDLRSNKISHVESDVLDKLRNTTLKSIYLSDNPIQCDCLNHPFLSYLQVNYLLIKDMDLLRCSNGEYISKVNLGDLCGTTPAVIASSISIAVIGIIFGCLAAFYYKYQKEIKIWLFWHGLLPRCCHEVEQEKTYDAFISFSHKDEDFVLNELLPELEGGTNPFKICLHFRDWMVGELIPTQIVKSVQESRRTVVVLSQNFLESVWCLSEFRTAHSSALKGENLKVIVILYGDIGPTDNLDVEIKKYLSMNTYVKWGDPWFWRKLRYALPHPTYNRPLRPTHNVSRKKGFNDRLEFIHSSIPNTEPEQNTSLARQVQKNLLVNKVKVPNGIKSNGLDMVYINGNGNN